MKGRDKVLRRLLQAARRGEEPVQMPFGFDTRVLASVGESAPNGAGLITLLVRRVTAIALVVIALAGAGLYGASRTERSTDTTNEYGIVDNAIQNNLGE